MSSTKNGEIHKVLIEYKQEERPPREFCIVFINQLLGYENIQNKRPWDLNIFSIIHYKIVLESVIWEHGKIYERNS